MKKIFFYCDMYAAWHMYKFIGIGCAVYTFAD